MDITRLLMWQLNKDSLGYAHTDFNFSRLNSNDLVPLINKPEYELSESVVASLESNSVVCIGALHKQQLIGYMFFCTSPVEPHRNSGGKPFSGIGLVFPENVRYVYKVLVLPEHRGKKVAKLILYYAAEYFQSRGIDWIVTTTDWTNSAFLNVTQSVGFKTVGTAAEIVLGSKHLYRLPRRFSLGKSAESALNMIKPDVNR